MRRSFLAGSIGSNSSVASYDKKLRRAKGRKTGGRFVQLPEKVFSSKEYSQLPARAVKLLIDLLSQFRGFNNGDMCLTWSIMKKKGWKSRNTLDLARRDLLESGFIVKTRQGGKHKASLYGVTFIALDDCDGKLDVGATNVPPNNWKNKSVVR